VAFCNNGDCDRQDDHGGPCVTYKCEKCGRRNGKHFNFCATLTQPPPAPSAAPAVWDLVQADMTQRDRVGQQRYGVRLQGHNGRDALRDLYEELLDAVAYTRQLIWERDNK
jgi:hypothetical protein